MRGIAAMGSCIWPLVSLFLVILLLSTSCNSSSIPINGFYYSPTPIGVDGGSTNINSYNSYFKDIHARDLALLSSNVNHIRISSLGTGSKNLGFLDDAFKYNISVIAGFGLGSYGFNSPKKLQKQITNLRIDFQKFITTHKECPAITMWCIGDVDDDMFTIGTSLQQYENFKEIVRGLIDIIRNNDDPSYNRSIAFTIRTRSFDSKQIPSYDDLTFDNWIFDTESETSTEIQTHVSNYGGSKGILIQLSKNAWDYANSIENTADQVSYLNSTLPYVISLPNVIGTLFMEFSDQWWRGASLENNDCISVNHYVHSPCGAIALDLNITGYSFYFNSARWGGVAAQYNLLGRHCIKLRDAFYSYMQLTGVNVTTIPADHCVYVYHWYTLPALVLGAVLVFVTIAALVWSLLIVKCIKQEDAKLLLNSDTDIEASEDFAGGFFAGPSSKVQAAPVPTHPGNGLVKLAFDENTSTWVTVDHDNYRLCYEIKMKCAGDDPNSIASYFLQQHVNKQKEILWKMLEHEQAAISANYKPKPSGDQDKHNSFTRRHSSILHSVRLNLGDVKKYSVLSENNAPMSGKEKEKASSVKNFKDVMPPAFGGNEGLDRPPVHPEAVSYIAAMENLHFRTLEGYFCWLHAKGKSKEYSKENKTFAELYSETLLFRIITSIAEHVLHCPERLAFLFHQVLNRKQMKNEKTHFELDLDEIHAGLEAIHKDSAEGINFDDINDCGMMEIPIQKTWRESSGIWVLLDILRNYGSIMFVKIWILAIAWWWDKCLSLDSSLSDIGKCSAQVWTVFSWIDSGLFGLTELILCFFVLWQNKWAVRQNWMRIVRAFIGVGCGGGICVHGYLGLPMGGYIALGYLLGLRFIGCLCVYSMPRYKKPLYISGKIQEAEKDKSKKEPKFTTKRIKPWLYWFLTLTSTLVLERYAVVPIAGNITFSAICTTQCPPHMLSCVCLSCRATVLAIFLLLIVTCMMDTFLIFSVMIAVFGYFEGRFRKVENVRETTEILVYVAQDSPLGQELIRAFGKNWSQCCQKWNAIIEELWESDLICTEDKEKLIVGEYKNNQSKDKVPQTPAMPNNTGPPPVPHLHTKNSSLRHKMPIDISMLNSTARYRISFFIRTLPTLHHKNRYCNASGRRTLPRVSQIITCYEETVLLSELDLKSKSGSLSNLEHLVTNFPDEWANFEQRMEYKQGCLLYDFLDDEAQSPSSTPSSPSSRLSEPPLLAPTQASFASSSIFRLSIPALSLSTSEHMPIQTQTRRYSQPDFSQQTERLRGKDPKRLLLEIRLWASHRSQTVARTVRGAVSYHKAVRCMLQHQDTDWTKYVELIISHQLYGKPEGHADTAHDAWKQKYEDVNLLMEMYKEYPIMLVYDYDKKSSPNEIQFKVNVHSLSTPSPLQAFSHATIIEQYDLKTDSLQIQSILPRIYPLRLGQASKTQGKSGNQTTLGLKAVSGHIIQMMDANMDGSISEGFKIPFVTSTFYLANNSRTHLRYRIIGFRETIFTGSSGAVGKCMANSEFSFGTIFQRVLASSLQVRMHYGHPDFIDSFWSLNRGGLSKASKQINLSEDIFAGFQAFARGEEIWHADNLEWQKGRETSFMTAAGFLWKISAGGSAMMRSRDLRLINDGLDLTRKFSLFYGSAGFFFNNMITNLSIIVYVLCFFFLSLGGVTITSIGLLKSPLGAEWLISLGMVTMLPLLSELWLEHGFFQGSVKFLGSVVQSAVLFTFHNKVVGETFSSCLITGKAQYVSTGRPNSYTYFTKKAAYHAYISSHYNSALQLFAMYSIYRLFIDASGGILPMIIILLAASIWLTAPVLFCPHPTDIVADYKVFLYFIMGAKPGMQGDQYESLFGYWLGQEKEEFEKALISSQLFGWASYLVRLFVLVLISPSNLWDAMYPFAVALGVNVGTTVIWKRIMGKNNVATLLWMFAPLATVGFVQPINSFFSREVFFGAIFFIHIMGALKYPLNLIALPILRLVQSRRAKTQAKPQGNASTHAHAHAQTIQSQGNAGDVIAAWLENVMSGMLFYHMHLYVALVVMLVQLTLQAILALLEVLCGLHSAVLLNSRMVGGVLLQQCAPMRKTYHGVFLRLATYQPVSRANYAPSKK